MFYALKLIRDGESCHIETIGEFADRKDADAAAQLAKQNDPIMDDEFIVATDPEKLMNLTIQDLEVKPFVP